MFVIIVGGGKVGTYLVSALIQAGHRVTLIENRANVVQQVRLELPEVEIFTGNGSSPDMLEKAGIRDAQVLAAVTGDDETNLVIATLGRFEFGVTRVIGRVNNPKNAWLFTEEMGVDVALNQADILTKLIIEEMSLGDMMVLLKLRRGEYSLVEEKLLPNSRFLHMSLKDLPLPAMCVIAAVIRHGKVLAPRGNMTFQVGDEVLVVISNESLSDLNELFAPL
jgi:trk system potassium uptake protein TrkA